MEWEGGDGCPLQIGDSKYYSGGGGGSRARREALTGA